MVKVCYVFLAEGFEEIEALTVVDLLRRDNILTETVSISDNKEVTGSHMITVTADRIISEIKLTDAAFLILPGGMPGTLNLKNCPALMDMITEFNETNRNLAAICAAPTIFGELGFLKGKKATCYSGMERQLKEAIVVKDEVVTDGNITTSRGVGTAIPFALEIIRILDSETEALAMKKKIEYLK